MAGRNGWHDAAEFLRIDLAESGLIPRTIREISRKNLKGFSD
jgi:hypothetical protein